MSSNVRIEAYLTGHINEFVLNPVTCKIVTVIGIEDMRMNDPCSQLTDKWRGRQYFRKVLVLI